MTASILIVDDEEIARQRIVKLLEEFDGDFQIKEARDAVSAGEELAAFDPDIIFLDVEMPVYSGFDFLKQHNLNKSLIIFQTAYSEYAVKAFEENAENYLLKPFSKQRFEEVLTKALSNIEASSQSNQYLRNIPIKIGLREKRIETSEILYFSYQDKTSYLHLIDKKYSCNLTMKDLEATLDPQLFIRIHRNHILNRHFVSSFSHTYPMIVTMENQDDLQVSKERRKMVKDFLTSDVP
ncbi:MAG: response regulator transcription factor [Pseudobacteriovorax sp.]|nr:response regulator transcription factor [Pseudobacteriovorax sp.]